MALSTSSNFAKPDDAFRAVVEAHRGLSDAESANLDAALVLILANHIGDIEVLRDAIALAQRRMADVSNNSSNSSNNMNTYKTVIARSKATKQSILSWHSQMDCFASLAMTETSFKLSQKESN
jgi:Protein of unknown function (DUF2783)